MVNFNYLINKGNMFTISDITEKSEFKIKSGTSFIIHEITQHKTYTGVSCHNPGQREGYYHNEIQDLVNFLNENNATKIN
jgi:hypothetical protein